MSKREWKFGLTAEERPDEFRCTVILRTGLRCGMWAKRGHDRCWKHMQHAGNLYISKPEARLPSAYGKHLHGAVKDRIAELLQSSRSEQIELYEELALMRDMAGNAVGLYCQVAESSASAEQLQSAGMLMADALKEVGSLADKIATIEAKSADTLTVHTLNGAVSQIVNIFFQVCGDEYVDLAKVVEQRIRSEVVLPIAEAKAGNIKPGDDVAAMNAMIPGPDDA